MKLITGACASPEGLLLMMLNLVRYLSFCITIVMAPNLNSMQIFACAAEVDEILPFARAFHGLVRRRPFLVQRLEEVLKKLLTSLEFFDHEGRKKIAIGASW